MLLYICFIQWILLEARSLEISRTSLFIFNVFLDGTFFFLSPSLSFFK